MCISAALTALFLAVTWASLWAFAADEPPTEGTDSSWIDPSTGHRVVRLSHEPGSASLYFHQNAYTADGDKLVITTPGGIATVNLETRAI